VRRAEPSAVAVVAVSAGAVGAGSAIGFMYGFLAPALRDDLGIGRTEVGLLISVYFGATGVASSWGGRLTDRIGARRAVRADMVLVAVIALASALAPGYGALLVLGAIAGAGYALANAGTNRAVGIAVPLRRRGFALNVKTTGVPLLVAVGALAGVPLADAVGWRWPLVAIAVVAAATAIAASFVLPGGTVAVAVGTSGVVPAGFWRFPVACFLLLVGTQPLYSWSVSYLVDERSVSAGAAGAVIAAASLAGVVSMMSVGRLSDRIGPHSRRPVLAALTAAIGIVTAGLAIGTRLPLGVVVVLLISGVAVQLSAIGTMHAAIVDVAPTAIGRASGITMTGYYLGALVAPVLFGALADTVGYATAWTVSAVCCFAGGVAFASTTTIAASSMPARAAGQRAVNTTG
jgi:CP family cyanate transporter-like MFS transporter